MSRDKFQSTAEDRQRAQKWLNKNGFGKLYGIVHPTVISLGEEFHKIRKETLEGRAT